MTINQRGGAASYEYQYQYHKNTGLQKLAKDKQVGHLFFDYFDNLSEVDLRYLHGSQLAEFFTKWFDEYPNPYPQRYRKNIPYGYVKQHGTLLMTLKGGEVVFPVLTAEPTASSITSEIEEADHPED